MTGLSAFLVSVISVCGTATADTDKPGQNSYREFMAKQYSAYQSPLPARSDEYRKIYEKYLNSIGQRSPADDQRDNGFTPSR